MKKQQIAVFGSAFNPPHLGHLDVIQQAAEQFDHVLVVPSYRHAFGKRMALYDVRIKMVKALLGELDKPDVISISTIEALLANERKKNEAIYTYNVLDALEQKHPSAQLTFVVGPDNGNPETWSRFYKAEEILRRWGIWIAEQNVNIRSTTIREAFESNHYDVKGFPKSVAALARKLCLYQGVQHED